MNTPKNLPEAPAPTEGDLSSTSSSTKTPSPTSTAQQSDNIAHALSGAGGGLLAMALTYPLITLSTRAQVESKRADTSTLAAVRHIVAREGISGLYSGLDSALFGISVTNFVYYYWYEWTRAALEKAKVARGENKRLGTVESMIAGAVAGSATVLITNPIWVVNTRVTAREGNADADAEAKAKEGGPAEKDVEAQQQQHDKKTKKSSPSTIGTLLKLLREEGPGALFAGVLPALVLVVNPILQYTIYEQLKNVIEKRRRVGPRDAFLLGAVGKLLATTITYPYITVKSRAHVAKKEVGKKAEGMGESLQRIVREEGYGGLYKGIVPKVSQSVLTAAFLFAFKDVLYDAMVNARRRASANRA